MLGRTYSIVACRPLPAAAGALLPCASVGLRLLSAAHNVLTAEFQLFKHQKRSPIRVLLAAASRLLVRYSVRRLEE
jgi:hypothetical protein